MPAQYDEIGVSNFVTLFVRLSISDTRFASLYVSVEVENKF